MILQKSFSCTATEYGQMAEEHAKVKLKELLEEKHVNVKILPTRIFNR